MRRFIALIVALPILLLVLWLALGRRTPAPVPEAAQPAPAAEVKAAPPAETEPAATATSLARVESASAPEREPVAAPAAEQPSIKLAELRGRFVLEGGAPAIGARISLEGWESNVERVMKYGKPKDWKNLSATCDSDGHFAIRFDPPRAYQFTLEASQAGCVAANWRWGELEPGVVRDLGECVLPRGGAVAGRVLDAQGKPTGDPWQVYADAAAVSRGEGSDNSRGYTEADHLTGQFRIENLPPGRVELKAHSELANWIAGPSVEVRAGETVEADISYAGPDNSRRITVATFSQPFYVFDDDVNEILLSAPGVEARKAHKIANSSQSFSFDDLQPGSYTITIDDPKFKPWRKDGVRPGQSVSARLSGSASVSLAVIDAETRTPVGHYALRVRFDEVNFSPNQFQVFGAKLDPPSGGLVTGLIPREQSLIVLAEGYAPCESRLENLEPGAVRQLVVELRHGTTLLVRVLEPDGKTPRPGQVVALAPSTPAGQEDRNWASDSDRVSQREAISAADGRASFAAVAAGSYMVHAELTPSLIADIEGVTVLATDTEKTVDLVIPANGSLVGRVLGFEGAPVEGCSLVVLPLDLDADKRSMLVFKLGLSTKQPVNPVARDGAFHARMLRAGRSSVSLQYPEATIHQGLNSSWSQPGAKIELGEADIPAGGELHKDFDLVGRLPGKVEADVLINGHATASVRVSVRSGDDQPRAGVIDLNANGHGLSGPIAAGAVRFDLSASDGDWSWTPPGSWTIASGATLRVHWDVQLVAGSLQVVDETSALPLVDRQVMILLDGEEFGGWLQHTTDLQGKLELKLVPAAYSLELMFDLGADGKPTQSSYQPARFNWTASGPVNAVLKLSKKP